MGYSTAIGLDVHARSISACAIAIGTGEVKKQRFGYDPGSVARWCATLAQPVKAVYESGVTGNHLCRTLRDDYNIDCVIGAVSRMFSPPADRKKKNDSRDAEFLARMLASDNIVEVYIPDEYCEAARDISRARDDARIALRVSLQHLTHFLLRHGYIWNDRTPTGALRRAWGSVAYDRWLKGIRFPQAADADVFSHYIDVANDCSERLAQMDGEVLRYASSERYKPVVDALCCLKGIDTLSAFSFATEIDDFSRFPNASKLSSWLGIVPSESSSGESTHQGPITKTGSLRLRRIITECSWSYTRCNTARKQLAKGQVVSADIAEHAHKGVVRLIRMRRHMLDVNKKAAVANAATARELAGWILTIGKMAQAQMAAHR
jgi:transposase